MVAGARGLGWVCAAVLLTGACSRKPTPRAGDAGPTATAVEPAGDAAVKPPPIDARVDDPRSHVTAIDSADTFRRFANQPGGVVRSGEVVKFLIDNRDYPSSEPPVYYINGNYTAGGDEPVSWVALHREWAEKTLPDFDYSLKRFSKTAYFTRSLDRRDFISGRVQTFERDGEVFYGVWFIEMDLIAESMLEFALAQIKRTFRAADHPLHLVTYSTHQTTATIGPWLAANGFVVHRLSDLLAGVPFRSLNPGEAWGILRVSPDDPQALRPDEIPVFDTLPLDLGVVAGTITTAFQDVASHVNVKAKQRNTPNLMLRDRAAVKRLLALDGTPVHLVVTDDGYRFEPTTGAIVRRKLAEALATRRWATPPADLSGAPVTFDAMCPDAPADCLALATRFGGKAAGLGFLAHREVIGPGSQPHARLGYRLSPLGYAVPIAAYKTFIDFNRRRDPTLAAALDKLIATERGDKPPEANERRALIRTVQRAIVEAPFPPGLYEQIAAGIKPLEAAYRRRFPGESLTKLKVRSSANVEDIPGFSGAGLHDSFTARLSESGPDSVGRSCELVDRSGDRKVKPRSLACSIKAVYASLWNLRAVSERSFRRFDHRGAYMGLALSPSYKHGKASPRKRIAANSVLITRVLNSPTVYGYQLSTQVKNKLVTNPKPDTLAELTILTFQLASVPAPTVLQLAKPRDDRPPRREPILSTRTMREIVAVARAVEEAYCRAKPTYFVVDGKRRKCHQVSNSQSKPTALDMELKIYGNRQILIKQVREFDGR